MKSVSENKHSLKFVKEKSNEKSRKLVKHVSLSVGSNKENNSFPTIKEDGEDKNVKKSDSSLFNTKGYL